MRQDLRELLELRKKKKRGKARQGKESGKEKEIMEGGYESGKKEGLEGRRQRRGCSTDLIIVRWILYKGSWTWILQSEYKNNVSCRSF